MLNIPKKVNQLQKGLLIKHNKCNGSYLAGVWKLISPGRLLKAWRLLIFGNFSGTTLFFNTLSLSILEEMFFQYGYSIPCSLSAWNIHTICCQIGSNLDIFIFKGVNLPYKYQIFGNFPPNTPLPSPTVFKISKNFHPIWLFHTLRLLIW